MKQTFVDSFYLLALFNQRDAAHGLALIASQAIEGILVTTDWVLAERADALSDPANRGGCAAFLEDLRRSPQVEIERASPESFDAGWELYRQRPDKDWSLTDCISFVVMERRRIVEALTGDHHYEQAGYRALLK